MENTIWQSSLTEEMVVDLSSQEVSLLVEALDQAVMEVCQNYEVKG
jgi:lipoate-protein ligase B